MDTVDFNDLRTKISLVNEKILAIQNALAAVLENMKANPKMTELEIQNKIAVAHIPDFDKVYIAREMIDINPSKKDHICTSCIDCKEGNHVCIFSTMHTKINYIESVLDQYSKHSFTTIGDRFFSLEPVNVAKLFTAFLMKAASLVVDGEIPNNVFINVFELMSNIKVVVIIIDSEISVFDLTKISTLNIVINTSDVLPLFEIELLNNLQIITNRFTATAFNINITGVPPLPPLGIGRPPQDGGSGTDIVKSNISLPVTIKIGRKAYDQSSTLVGATLVTNWADGFQPDFSFDEVPRDLFDNYIYTLKVPNQINSGINATIIVVDELKAIQMQKTISQVETVPTTTITVNPVFI